MKKIIYSFIFFLLVFLGFSWKGQALDSFSCTYYDDVSNTTFFVFYRGESSIFKASLRSNYGNKGPGDVWDVSDFKAEEGCPLYLYYKQNTGGLFGSDWSTDKVYGSNSAQFDKEYDIQLSLQGPYAASKPNAELKQLLCAYNDGKITVRIDNKGSYQVFQYQNELFSTNIYSFSSYTSTFKDNFSIKHFWNEETGVYTCPSTIWYGESTYVSAYSTMQSFEIGYDDLTEDFKQHWYDYLIGGRNKAETLSLTNNSSYIEYDLGTEGQLCVYTKEEALDEWYFSLTKYSAGVHLVNFKESVIGRNKTVSPNNIKIQSDIMNDCKNLPVVYSDCATTDNCTISETEFSGSEKFVLSDKNREDATTVQEAMGEVSGDKFKQKICQLKPYLAKLSSSASSSKYKLSVYEVGSTTKDEYTLNQLPCDNWGFETKYKCLGNSTDCKNNLPYETEQRIRSVISYCNDIYDKYSDRKSNELYKNRMQECIDFNSFYSNLINDGIIEDYTANCGILSNDLEEKLIFILDLIKIAGPILALGLGIVDFVKVIANGDADKEMKTAFKHFTIRVTAAALLFLIPVILAFLMDTFLGNQSGYNEDNPFCNIVDWND